MAKATFSLADGLGVIDMSFKSGKNLDRETVLAAIGSVLPGGNSPAPQIDCTICATPTPRAQAGIVWDTVAIYDNAGIPSIMRRFRKVTNKELFGGSEKTHPAFIIGGEEYDEIYISVYENTMINGKPYSLPYQKPATNITMEDFAKACFDKGEGWHCLTAAEWGLLANTSLKLGTLPHGNTNCGRYGNTEERGAYADDDHDVTLTGSGPATWTHDHTATGVHDLSGNIYEFCRGARIIGGKMQAAKNNDAALPETDLSENGKDWEPIADNGGRQICGGRKDGRTIFTATGRPGGFEYDEWENAKTDCVSEQMKELALYAGEPHALVAVDGTDGEYILVRGGRWSLGSHAGVFYVALNNPRSYVCWYFGGRSAYFKKKRRTPLPETLSGER